MPDSAPNAELLRSLARLVRGLSALFWGLPAALIICLGTAGAGWLKNFGVVPPLAVTGLLCFGLWQMTRFQKQERPWRSALDRARLLALVNFGLSPFLYWWNQVPGQVFFVVAVAVLALSALLFLFHLNLVLRRLAAMLPDETLRHETRQFTALNQGLLLGTVALLFAYLIVMRVHPNLADELAGYLTSLLPSRQLAGVLLVLFDKAGFCFFLFFVLLPLAMTMALIWKTKEVILDSVFNVRN